MPGGQEREDLGPRKEPQPVRTHCCQDKEGQLSLEEVSGADTAQGGWEAKPGPLLSQPPRNHALDGAGQDEPRSCP